MKPVTQERATARQKIASPRYTGTVGTPKDGGSINSMCFKTTMSSLLHTPSAEIVSTRRHLGFHQSISSHQITT